MRKLNLLTLAVVIALVCATGGCAKEQEAGQAIENASAEVESEQETKEAASTEESTEEEKENVSDEEVKRELQILHPIITTNYETAYDGTRALFRTEASEVRFMEQEYKELKKKVKEFNQKSLEAQKNYIEEERETWANEETDFAGIIPLRFNVFVNVARADEQLFSLHREESMSIGDHTEYITDTVCYDTKTGNEITLQDITADREKLLQCVLKTLEEKDQSIFYEDYQDTVKTFFSDDFAQIPWTISNHGVTFYIDPLNISPNAAGVIQVELPFDKTPGIFNSDYIPLKRSYVLRLKEHNGAEMDVDDDGKTEFVSYSAEMDGTNLGGEIMVICDDHIFSTNTITNEDYLAGAGNSSEGFLIHTNDGKTFFYLFNEGESDECYVNIFELTTGTPVYIKSMEAYARGNQISDADSFIMWDNTEKYKLYYIGKNGLPETDGISIPENGNYRYWD